MRVPTLTGVIRRRVLVNFRVDPAAIRKTLPDRFRPQLVGGSAIAGICLIRLEQLRPRGLPAFVGVASENAAHRVAVCWDDEKGAHSGVYIPRRDSDSVLNRLIGGRLFPGAHHRALFDVEDRGDRIALSMRSADGATRVAVRGRRVAALPTTSRFASLDDASRFFELGALGYSDTRDPGRLDGLELATKAWKVEPLEVEEVHSSFFEDRTAFPAGSVAFDCALLMRDIPHVWNALPSLASH